MGRSPVGATHEMLTESPSFAGSLPKVKGVILGGTGGWRSGSEMGGKLKKITNLIRNIQTVSGKSLSLSLANHSLSMWPYSSPTPPYSQPDR